MGKALIIKGADFSGNAVAHISFSSWQTINIDALTIQDYSIASTNKWQNSGGCVFVPANPGDIFKITANQSSNAHYAFLTSTTIVSGTTPPFATGYEGRIIITAGESATFTVPAGTVAVYVLLGTTSSYNNKPSSVQQFI